jgi:hypothetical protein
MILYVNSMYVLYITCIVCTLPLVKFWGSGFNVVVYCIHWCCSRRNHVYSHSGHIMWFNITVLNIMMLIVTGKLQNFTIFNKTKKFVRILLEGIHKDFAAAPRIAFLPQK